MAELQHSIDNCTHILPATGVLVPSVESVVGRGALPQRHGLGVDKSKRAVPLALPCTLTLTKTIFFRLTSFSRVRDDSSCDVNRFTSSRALR